MASGLNGVQACVKDKVPQALFVYCYAHTLNLVMSQGASKIKECKIFGQILVLPDVQDYWMSFVKGGCCTSHR